MPDHQYPPPPYDTGGSLEPRQLNRWLDVHPQGGSLKRTQGYFSIPAFNVPVTWLGYSDIVLAWNYVSQNRFILPDLSLLADNANYVLCISYEQDGVVYRYKLNDVDGIIFGDIPLYNKQIIDNNFRLEVWSTGNANVSEASLASLLTSVKGWFDYRFAQDFSVASGSSGITTFYASAGLPVTDLGFTTTKWFSNGQAVPLSIWSDSNGFYTFTKVGAGQIDYNIPNGLLASYPLSFNNNCWIEDANHPISTTSQHIFTVSFQNNLVPPTLIKIFKGAINILTIVPTSSSGIIVSPPLQNSIFTISSASYTIANNQITVSSATVLIDVQFKSIGGVNSFIINFWNPQTTLFLGSLTGTASAGFTFPVKLTVGADSANQMIQVFDYVLYQPSNDANTQNVLLFEQNKFFRNINNVPVFDLPLVFPDNSNVPNN